MQRNKEKLYTDQKKEWTRRKTRTQNRRWTKIITATSITNNEQGDNKKEDGGMIWYKQKERHE